MYLNYYLQCILVTTSRYALPLRIPLHCFWLAMAAPAPRSMKSSSAHPKKKIVQVESSCNYSEYVQMPAPPMAWHVAAPHSPPPLALAVVDPAPRSMKSSSKSISMSLPSSLRSGLQIRAQSVHTYVGTMHTCMRISEMIYSKTVGWVSRFRH